MAGNLSDFTDSFASSIASSIASAVQTALEGMGKVNEANADVVATGLYSICSHRPLLLLLAVRVVLASLSLRMEKDTN